MAKLWMINLTELQVQNHVIFTNFWSIQCYSFLLSVGRVHGIRESGSKLVFYVLQSEGVKLQIMANLQAYDSADGFYADVAKIKRGDIIGVRGYPTRTKTGELSIVPRKMELLSPCLHAMPHYYGLKDKVQKSCSIFLFRFFNLGMSIPFFRRHVSDSVIWT